MKNFDINKYFLVEEGDILAEPVQEVNEQVEKEEVVNIDIEIKEEEILSEHQCECDGQCEHCTCQDIDWIDKDKVRLRGFEVVSDEHRKHKDKEIIIPQRGSGKSAGYDIVTPCDIRINPRCHSELVFMDIKAYMQEDEVLQIYVRSSIGCKQGLVLANGTGIIDSDYYNNPNNDGNIGIKLYNTTEKIAIIKKGTRIAQGIFMKYLVADDDENTKERIGGFGSSGK